MILDTRLELAQAAPIAGSVGTHFIGDTIDLKAIGRDTIPSEPGPGLYCVIRVAEGASSSGSGTVQFHIVSDAQAAIATDGTATYHASTARLSYLELLAGRNVVCIKLPHGRYERYLGILATIGTASITAGAVDVFMTHDPALYRGYGDNVA